MGRVAAPGGARSIRGLRETRARGKHRPARGVGVHACMMLPAHCPRASGDTTDERDRHGWEGAGAAGLPEARSCRVLGPTGPGRASLASRAVVSLRVIRAGRGRRAQTRFISESQKSLRGIANFSLDAL